MSPADVAGTAIGCRLKGCVRGARNPIEKIILAAFVARGVTAGFATLANASAALIAMSGHLGDINILLTRTTVQGLSH
jgi:hypothetical protein